MTATTEAIAPNLGFQQAARHVWDVVVVGAGPSGALAALELARQGASVLLLDKAAFPRQKVCGCCVNVAALGILRTVGLEALPDQLGARPLRELMLAEGQRRVKVALPSGVALSREVFDAALIRQAIKAGANFLPQTAATLDGGEERFHPAPQEAPCVNTGRNAQRPRSASSEATAVKPWGGVHRLTLRYSDRRICVKARVVLVANGLGGGLVPCVQAEKLKRVRHSRIGAGIIIDEVPRWCHAGTICMVYGSGGYVGLVQLEDGRLNVAAAFDPTFVRSEKGPGQAAAKLIAQAGLPQVNGLCEGSWQGTPRLTQHRVLLAQERLFVIGDAAGYIEPFTGEGIAWALWCGVAVSPIAVEAIRHWTPALSDRWDALYRQQIDRRQWACRLLAAMLRKPVLARAATAVLSWVPSLASPVVQYVNAPLPVHLN